MSMKRKLTENEKIRQQLEQELKDAVVEYHRAEQIFNYAEYDYIEVANSLLTAAQMKVDALYKRNQIILKEMDGW